MSKKLSNKELKKMLADKDRELNFCLYVMMQASDALNDGNTGEVMNIVGSFTSMFTAKENIDTVKDSTDNKEGQFNVTI